MTEPIDWTPPQAPRQPAQKLGALKHDLRGRNIELNRRVNNVRFYANRIRYQGRQGNALSAERIADELERITRGHQL